MMPTYFNHLTSSDIVGVVSPQYNKVLSGKGRGRERERKREREERGGKREREREGEGGERRREREILQGINTNP